MAGKIIADTLEHSTAGSLTTDYVVNGSAKAWVNFNGTGTIATRDSLNVSGLVDNGTGDYSQSMTSGMNTDVYTLGLGGGNGRTSGVGVLFGGFAATPQTSTTFRFLTFQQSPIAHDPVDVTTVIHGDLA